MGRNSKRRTAASRLGIPRPSVATAFYSIFCRGRLARLLLRDFRPFSTRAISVVVPHHFNDKIAVAALGPHGRDPR